MTTPKLTLLVGNNSVQIVSAEVSSSSVPCAFLLAILAVSLLLNAFVLLAVIFSPLRSSFFNCLLAGLSGAAVLEGLLNVTSSAVISSSWEELYFHYGPEFVEVFCRTSACATQMSAVLQSFLLSFLSMDRSSLLKANGKQNPEGEAAEDRARSQRRLKRLLPASCVVCVAVVFPVATGMIATRLVEQRMSCSPVFATHDAASISFAVILLVIGYCLPWAFTIRSWCIIFLRVHNEQRRLRKLELVAHQRAAERRSPVRGLGSSLGFYAVPWSQIWGPVNYVTGEGFRFFGLAGALAGLHLVLVMPSATSVQVTQFFDSYDVSKPAHDFLTLRFINKTELPAELQPFQTNLSDEVFAWTRYCFVVLAPVLILSVHKEIRRQCESLMCACCGSKNAIGQSQPRSVSAYVKQLKDKDFRRKHEYQKKRKPDKYRRVADYRTPVLFATSEGLHLRTAQTETEVEKSVFWTLEPKFVCEFCDVIAHTPSEESKKKKAIPRLSETPPPLMRSDLRLEDEVTTSRDKKGKCVRFAQRVNEIPLSESGIYSSDDQTAVVQIQPARNPFETFLLDPELKALPNRVTFDRLQEKRYSDTFIKFPNMSDVSKNLSRDRNKSLELDLIQNGKLNESSASLLLSLSQRMRNRNS